MPTTIQTGTVTTSADGGATVTGSVNFSTAFDTIPKMRYTMNAWNTATNNYSVTFSNITRTGFSWAAKNKNSSWEQTRFVWTAYVE